MYISHYTPEMLTANLERKAKIQARLALAKAQKESADRVIFDYTNSKGVESKQEVSMAVEDINLDFEKAERFTTAHIGGGSKAPFKTFLIDDIRNVKVVF